MGYEHHFLIWVLLWAIAGCIAAGYRVAYVYRSNPDKTVPAYRWSLLLHLIGGFISLGYIIYKRRFTYGWMWPWSKDTRAELRANNQDFDPSTRGTL